jgi:hypothetical protein
MRLSFTGLCFQNLRVLSLRNFVLEPSAGVEPFILQYATTLVWLELISCKLFIPNDEEPTRWEHIWGSFATGITALVARHFDESRVGVFEQRYVRHQVRDGPISYWDVEAPAHLDVADAAALKRFYVTVAARSEEARGAARVPDVAVGNSVASSGLIFRRCCTSKLCSLRFSATPQGLSHHHSCSPTQCARCICMTPKVPLVAISYTDSIIGIKHKSRCQLGCAVPQAHWHFLPRHRTYS